MIKPIVKFKLLFWCLLVLSSTIAFAKGSCSTLIDETSSLCLPIFEVKTGYFFFSDSKLRKVYRKGGLDIQLCASYPLRNLTNNWTLNAYGALEYFQKSGHSLNGHQKTSLWSIPANFGLKPVYTINPNLNYYLAMGPRYFYLHQRNHSSYVYKNKSRNGIGFFINTGFNYVLCNRLVLDIFGEYSYAKIHFHRSKPRIYTRHIQTGGFTFGGGIGYSF